MKVITDIFHAGLGVVAATEEQARETFGRMVDKGKQFGTDDRLLFSRATREARELGQQVERRVERTVSTTLNRAGVPSRNEIDRLIRRVEALTRKVDELKEAKHA